jgi:hypothetical protein
LIRLPVVTELHDPLESSNFINVVLNQTSNNIKSVDINDDKSIDRNFSQSLQRASNEGNSLFSLLLKELVVLLKSIKLTIVHSCLYVFSPVNLRSVKDDLSSLFFDPFCSGLLLVGVEADPESLTDTKHHLAFEFGHPEFYTSVVRVDTLHEINLLALGRNDTMHSVVRSEVKVTDSLKHLLKMGFNLPDLLSLGQNFKQIVVRQEVETTEERTFSLKVILKSLLHNF